jgi:hypothetical protein
LQSYTNTVAPKPAPVFGSRTACKLQLLQFTASQERSLNLLHELLRAKLALDPNLHKENINNARLHNSCMRVWTVNYYCVRIESTLSQEHTAHFLNPMNTRSGQWQPALVSISCSTMYTIHSAVHIRNSTVEMSRYKHSLYKLGWGIYETRV